MSESAERIPLAVMTRGPNLLASVQLENLIVDLRKLAHEAELPLGLVIFDTLSRSIPGGDENTAEDMTMVVKAADSIRDDLGAATAYVHHSGKDASKGARGHSALFAAADLVMRIEDHAATVEKVRDGVSGERYPFRLDPIEIGTDADGDAVYTCLLSPSDQPITTRKPKPTGKNQQILFKEITALAVDGEVSPGTSEIPKGAKIIRFEDLAEKAIPRFAGIEPFRARARIAEALTSLQASGFVGVHKELVWVIR